MKHLISVLAVVLFGVTAAFAQYSAGDVSHSGTYSTSVPAVTIKGYLMDEPCAETHMNTLLQTAIGHPTGCSLKAVDRGLGMVYNGQWVPFDNKGSQKALDVVKKSEREQGLIVAASGIVKDNRFVVQRIKEIKSLQ